VHYARAVNAVNTGQTAQAKAHAAAVSAGLSAAAVYAEWAPLAPLMRSGLMEACGHFLASSEFRSQACEVLRHIVHRRRGDTVNGAIASGAAAGAGGGGGVAALAAAGAGTTDDAAKEAAADAAAVVSGLTGMCRSLVGRCRLTVSKPVLKAPMVSSLGSYNMMCTAFKLCFQFQLAPLPPGGGGTPRADRAARRLRHGGARVRAPPHRNHGHSGDQPHHRGTGVIESKPLSRAPILCSISVECLL